jgi:ABC-type transport system involved in multi-copper enzyme maturation permease subunit
MDSLPIIERELRQLARKPMTYRIRAGTGLAAALISLGFMAVGVVQGSDPAHLGRQVFQAVAILTFGFSLLAGPILTADCLSEEKRLGTLGLLFLTNLRGWDIVAGKLVALALPAIHCLLAVLPILGISFFMGGVTGGEFLRTALVLADTLLFSLAAGMLASALCRDGRKALAGSVLLILIAAAGLPGMALFLSGGTLPGNPGGLLASPGYLLWLTPEANYIAATNFWTTLGVNQLVSWGSLLVAGFCLPHTWQDRPAKNERANWRAWWREWPPRRRWEQARREKLLAVNPVLWLARRNSGNSLGMWLFLLTSLGFWLGGAYRLNKPWLRAEIVFLVVYCLHAVLKLRVAWEASRRFAEDRNSGALEVLLCTPLKEENIWKGWLGYVKRRFLAQLLALLLVDFFLMNAGLGNNGWWGGDGTWGAAFLAGMGLLLADSYALSWVGIWQGLTARTAMRASLNTILYVLILPAAGCLGVLGILGLLAPSAIGIPFGAMTSIWFAVGYLSDAVLCARAMVKLGSEFRAAAIYGVAGDRRGWNWWGGHDVGDVLTYEPVAKVAFAGGDEKSESLARER